MSDKHGLLTGPIDETLTRMTIPMVFGLLAILMFNLVDTFFISLLGTHALAAISFTFPITFAVTSITMGLGAGLSTSVARLLGQNKSHAAASMTAHGLLLAVLLIVIMVSLGYFTIDPLFKLLGADETLLPLIREYMVIWYPTIPLLVIPMVGNASLRASGDTKTPAKIMVVAGVINGILDPLLIFGYGPFPELGIQGAAIASAISWAAALTCSLYMLTIKEKLLSWPSLLRLPDDWRAILSIGTPAALSNVLTPISGAVLMWLLASQGAVSVAAYGAAQRVESLMLIVMMALTSALTPMMAQNFGAGNPERAFQTLFRAIRFSLMFQFLMFIAMVPLSHPIAVMFSQEAGVQEKLWHYLLIVPLSYGLQGALMMLVSALNAMKKPIISFGFNLTRLFLLVLPLAWLGSEIWQTEGLFIGIAVANGISGIVAYLTAVHFRRQALAEWRNSL